MVSDSESQQLSRRILELAAAQGALTNESLNAILDLGGDACDHAIARELISTADIDLLRPLADPTGFLPGYEIIELIGQGAAGAVYRARQVSLRRDVALKLLKSGVLDDSTVTARTQLEARIGASLQHPGIVTVYDYGVHQQRIYLAMELLKGESLEAVIDRDGVIEAQESLRVTRQVSVALRYANTEGVVHRDIKPGNLMLTEDNAGTSDLASGKAIKLTDFGLAFNAQKADATRLTVAGATLGTPSYVAPEQLESTNVDQRADIYALGATLFHMVTGQRPFGNANAFKALAAKMQGSETWLEEMDESVPAPIRQLIIDMTRLDPAARIQDYESLEQRIDQALEGRMPPEIASDDAGLVKSIAKTNKKWLLAAGAGVLALLIPGLIYLLPTGDGTDRKIPQREREVDVLDQVLLLNIRKQLPDGRRRGGWDREKDEGAPVLAGENGFIRYQIDDKYKRSGFYEFRVSIDTKPGGEVDVCFGFGPDGRCSIARVKKDRVVMGRGRIFDEPAFGEGKLDAFLEFEPSGEEQLLYQQPNLSNVFIYRQRTFWYVNVNGRELGAVLAKPGDDPAIYVRVHGGKAYFSDIWLESQEPVKKVAVSANASP